MNSIDINIAYITQRSGPSSSATPGTLTSHMITNTVVSTVFRTLLFTILTIPSITTFCKWNSINIINSLMLLAFIWMWLWMWIKKYKWEVYSMTFKGIVILYLCYKFWRSIQAYIQNKSRLLCDMCCIYSFWDMIHRSFHRKRRVWHNLNRQSTMIRNINFRMNQQ